MLENKRKFERFDLFLITRIGQEGDTSRHPLGLVKNFSRDGISIEKSNFDFAPDNDLNLELCSPKGSAKIPLTGNVVWKQKAENTSIAGIRLKFQDEKVQNEILEEISYFGDIAKERLFLNVETDATVAATSLSGCRKRWLLMPKMLRLWVISMTGTNLRHL
jgi:hypothetical protein